MGGVALTPLTGGLSAVVAAGTIAAGAAGGATLGGLTGGAVAATEKEHHGISEAFVTEVADAIDCGESALFALIETEDPDWAVQYFRGTGGKIIRTNLSPSERERVQQMLSGED
jgi:uncharacterized membrane protein